MIHLGVDKNRLDVEVGNHVEQSWNVFSQSICIQRCHRNRNDTEAEAGVEGVEELFRVSVDEDDVFPGLNPPLVSDEAGDGRNLEVELLPGNALSFAAAGVDGAVRQFLRLPRHSPLEKIDDGGKVVEWSRRAIINHHFPIIDAGILLLLGDKDGLALLRGERRPYTSDRVHSDWKIPDRSLHAKENMDAR